MYYKISEPTKPLWVSVTNACMLSGLSRAKLYRMISDGTIKSVNVGKKRLISYKSIEDLGSVAEVA
jgi:excisionase family DNA binding protein